jgi:hypothetical protein
MSRKIFRLSSRFLLIVFAVSIIYGVEIFKIRENPFKYKNEAVEVEGFITQYVVGDSTTTSFYYLKGDWGSLLKVLTEKEKPEIGKRYKIRGIVNIDETNNDIFLVEMQRQCLNCETAVVEGEDEGTTEDKTFLYILIGAAGLFLILVIVIAIALTSKKKREYLTPVPGQDVTGESAETEVLGGEIVEGSTIKMSTPPPGTLKLLPGRLEVVSGDDTVKEIRFYKTKTQQEPEMTFGRSTGPAYTHIQLKPMTVSAKHAKILFKEGKYILVNYSSTNPTVVNGQPMEADASIELKENDKVEMGEVTLLFHST